MRPKTYQLLTREISHQHELSRVIHSTGDLDAHERVIEKLHAAKHGEIHDKVSSYGNSRPLKIVATSASNKYNWLTPAQKQACQVDRIFPSAVKAAEAVGVTAQTFRSIMHQTRRKNPETNTFIVRGVVFQQLDPQ